MKYVPRRSSSACAQSISQAPHHSWGSFGVEIALPEPDNLPTTTPQDSALAAVPLTIIGDRVVKGYDPVVLKSAIAGLSSDR